MLTNPPGIEDVFPERMAAWDFITGSARDVFRLNNYKEIIIPVLEFMKESKKKKPPRLLR